MAKILIEELFVPTIVIMSFREHKGRKKKQELHLNWKPKNQYVEPVLLFLLVELVQDLLF